MDFMLIDGFLLVRVVLLLRSQLLNFIVTLELGRCKNIIV